MTDVCVPISTLAQAVRETQDDIERSGLSAPILGHVGDGNFHAILLIDPQSDAEKKTAQGLSARMAERSLALGAQSQANMGLGWVNWIT